MTRAIMNGCNGKMGQCITGICAQDEDIEIVAGIDTYEGIGYTAETNNNFFDIGVEVETMIQAAQKKGKKILIGIDEVSKSEEMVKFASEYGRWLRAGLALPVKILMSLP